MITKETSVGTVTRIRDGRPINPGSIPALTRDFTPRAALNFTLSIRLVLGAAFVGKDGRNLKLTTCRIQYRDYECVVLHCQPPAPPPSPNSLRAIMAWRIINYRGHTFLLRDFPSLPSLPTPCFIHLYKKKPKLAAK